LTTQAEKDKPAKVNQNDPKLLFFVDFCRFILSSPKSGVNLLSLLNSVGVLTLLNSVGGLTLLNSVGGLTLLNSVNTLSLLKISTIVVLYRRKPP
jgi:hypothetical protein